MHLSIEPSKFVFVVLLFFMMGGCENNSQQNHSEITIRQKALLAENLKLKAAQYPHGPERVKIIDQLFEETGLNEVIIEGRVYPNPLPNYAFEQEETCMIAIADLHKRGRTTVMHSELPTECHQYIERMNRLYGTSITIVEDPN